MMDGTTEEIRGDIEGSKRRLNANMTDLKTE